LITGQAIACRPGCGACCIAPSISSTLPGSPQGKAAGVPCVHLGAAFQCLIFGQPQRPQVCKGLQPSLEMCGQNREQALLWLERLERRTAP
jgi:Fe-S-cluster containining protein